MFLSRLNIRRRSDGLPTVANILPRQRFQSTAFRHLGSADMKRRSIFAVNLFALTLWVVPAFAAGGRQVDVNERIKGAQRVVVAKAVKITPEWRTNEHGDKLIVSHVTLEVEETFKGAPANVMSMDIEGGTLNGVTLVVSSLPSVKPGDRAVFMLDAAPSGSHVPHLKGMGILKLDSNNHIERSDLRLDDIRRVAASAGR